jgi:DNA-binding CsgD family transcriptional regulator
VGEVTGLSSLTAEERKTLLLLADNGMNVTRVSEASFISRASIYNRIMSIRAKTGIDPQDFWGLSLLLTLMENEKEENE